jgi:hypothetical protein
MEASAAYHVYLDAVVRPAPDGKRAEVREGTRHLAVVTNEG